MEELQQKHQEWDDYRARTGETHPEEQESVDDIVRQANQSDDREANEEQEDNEQR